MATPKETGAEGSPSETSCDETSVIKTREPGEGLRRRNQGAGQIRPSLISERVMEPIRYLALTQLISFSSQSRKIFDLQEIQSLAETIKTYGIRQPLTVLPCKDDLHRFEIVSGERRFRAAQLLGLEKVPCILLADGKQAEEIALVENIQRTDLNPIELGQGYCQLIDTGRCRNSDEVARALSVSRSQVFEYMQYAKLPEGVRSQLMNLPVARAFLRKINACGSEEEMLKIIAAFKADLDGMKEDKEREEAKPKTSKAKRVRRKIHLLSISFDNGELQPQLRGLKVCPKEIHPQIKELLLKIAAELES